MRTKTLDDLDQERIEKIMVAMRKEDMDTMKAFQSLGMQEERALTILMCAYLNNVTRLIAWNVDVYGMHLGSILGDIEHNVGGVIKEMRAFADQISKGPPIAPEMPK